METRNRNKKEVQALETRRKIVRAAVQLFARQGYHKTTIADLAQAIGLTSGAIFHHFASKEALLEAVVDWLSRGIQMYADFVGHKPASSSQLVEQVMRVMCDHFRKNPEATICLAALATEFAGSSHPMEARIRAVYEIFIDPFTRALATHPKVADPRAAATAFFGAVQGIAIQGLLREDEQSIDQLADGFMGLLLAW